MAALLFLPQNYLFQGADVKTITENATKLSKYLFDDSKAVSMGSDKITIGDPSDPDFYIGDLNSGNATLLKTSRMRRLIGWGVSTPTTPPQTLNGANSDWEDPEPKGTRYGLDY